MVFLKHKLHLLRLTFQQPPLQCRENTCAFSIKLSPMFNLFCLALLHLLGALALLNNFQPWKGTTLSGFLAFLLGASFTWIPYPPFPPFLTVLSVWLNNPSEPSFWKDFFWTWFHTDKNDFKLVVLLPSSPKCWDYRHAQFYAVGVESRVLCMVDMHSSNWAGPWAGSSCAADTTPGSFFGNFAIGLWGPAVYSWSQQSHWKYSHWQWLDGKGSVLFSCFSYTQYGTP